MEGKEGRRGRGGGKEERGPRPLPLVQFGCPWGTRAPLWAPLSFSPMAHEGPLLPRGVPVTPRFSELYPNHFETISVSEYHRTIYQSLPLDHFETPRLVRDLIQDSEQHWVTKSHNS